MKNEGASVHSIILFSKAQGQLLGPNNSIVSYEFRPKFKLIQAFDDDDCFKVALASRHSGYPQQAFLHYNPTKAICRDRNQSKGEFLSKHNKPFPRPNDASDII